MARLWKEKARRASNEEALRRSQWFQFRKLLLPMMRGESVRDYMERNLDQSLVGQVYDVFIIMLSLFQVLVFVWFNRFGPGKNADGSDFVEPLWSEYIEIIFGVIFSFDYILRFYVARSRVNYVSSAFAIVDLLTVLPVWITVCLNLAMSGSIFTPQGGSLSNQAAQQMEQTAILRPIRVLRVRFLFSYAHGVKLATEDVL